MTLNVIGTSLSDVWSPTGSITDILDSTGDVDCCCGCVCTCDALTNAWNAVDALAVEIVGAAGCGGTTTGSLLPSVGTPPAGKTDCYHWGGSFTSAEMPPFDLVVWCDGATVGVAITPTDVANCSFGDVTVVSVTCDNDADTFTATIEVDVLGGGAPPDPCPCTGGTITITVTYP